MTRRLWILSFVAGAWALFLVAAVASVFTYKLLQPGPVPPVPLAIQRAPCPPTRALRAEPLEVVVKQTGDHTCEIDRATLESVLGNMRRMSRSARIVPEIRDGKPAGFRLYSVHPDGPFARLGMQNALRPSSLRP